MSLASFRAKVDLMRHVARTKGLRTAARRTYDSARDLLGHRRAQLVYPRVQWGDGVIIRGRLELQGPGSVIIGDHCTFDGGVIHTVTPDATVIVGDGCYLNGTNIIASASVRVGAHCILGASVISDTDFHGVARDQRSSKGEVRPVVLEENVWVGAGVAIFKGVEVGRDVVIGGGAIVRRSIPAGKIVIGNPAQVAGDVGTDGDR